MDAIRSILLHIDASPRSGARLLLARELAARLAATLTALYAARSAALEFPFTLTDGMAAALPALLQLDAERRSAARKLFDAAASSESPPAMHWRELVGEPPTPDFSREALYTDLLVLGQYDAGDPNAHGTPPDFVVSVLIASGKPALIVPYTGSFDDLGRRVLIAWKPTREAARAVSAALPLLRHAQRVHLCLDGGADEPDDGARLTAWLRLHGVEAPIEQHAAVAADMAGEGLLSLAADADADLLVMGCYGHSRARELVLGGASRTVLRSMTLPVLMAH